MNIMKKLLSIVFAFTLLVTSVSKVSAFSFGDFGSRFRGEDREEFREEKKATIEAKRLELRNENRDERHTKISNLFGVMLKRYEDAIERLNKLVTKIESRLAKIKADDPAKNVTAIETQIKNAKDKLALVPAKIDTLKTDFDAMLASTTPKDLFKTVLADAKAIKSDLKDVHKILVHVIGDIKGLRIGEE